MWQWCSEREQETHDGTASQPWKIQISRGTHSEREHAVLHLLPQAVLCPLVLVHNLLQTLTLSCSRAKLCSKPVQSNITLLYIMSVGGGREGGREGGEGGKEGREGGEGGKEGREGVSAL